MARSVAIGRHGLVGAALFVALAGSGCVQPGERPRACAPAPTGRSRADEVSCGRRVGDRLERRGEEIIACGQLFRVGTPVRTWLDPGGFDAYLPQCWFDADALLPKRPVAGCATPSRLSVGRRLAGPAGARVVPARAWTLEALREQVRMFVIHYDAAWTSRNCFRVLHDVRGLSVHFLLDLDGTIYQTCDLKERARHAGAFNDVSIGVEIAHPGTLEGRDDVARAYRRDADGVRLVVPARFGAPGGAGFVPRPARAQPVRGSIHGRSLTQYDFTDAQYHALARLLAAVHRVFPRVRLEAPRGPDGAVSRQVLSPEQSARFEGVVGHWHLSRHKVDPGPAFDWERVLAEARALCREDGVRRVCGR